MPLNYDASKCSDEAQIMLARERVLAWNLACATVSTGINPITKANFEKFWLRYCVIQHSIAGYLFLDHDEAAKCVGFSTNASKLTDTQFNKNVIENIYRTAPRVIRHAPGIKN